MPSLDDLDELTGPSQVRIRMLARERTMATEPARAETGAFTLLATSDEAHRMLAASLATSPPLA